MAIDSRRIEGGIVPHPTDARLKCLTMEQVQQFATLHVRPLQRAAAASFDLREEVHPLVVLEEHAPQENQTQFVSGTPSLSDVQDLRRTICTLEGKIMTLQETATQLTREWLRERSERYEQRLSTLEVFLSPRRETRSSGQKAEPVGDRRPKQFVGQERSLLPLTLRGHAHVLPAQIEYRADGTYAIISAEKGELLFLADSPEWFDWLATHSSFRFVGQHGRFGASRRYNRDHMFTRSWSAHRCIHQRNYNRHLGLTEHLTLARLEQMAATFQTYVDMR